MQPSSPTDQDRGVKVAVQRQCIQDILFLRGRVAPVVVGVLLVVLLAPAAGCRPAQPMGAQRAATNEETATRMADSERRWQQQFSPEGLRIYDLLKAGRVDSAKRLLEDFKDRSRGRAETEILRACWRAAEPAAFMHDYQETMVGLVAQQFALVRSPVDEIKHSLEVALDVDGKWKPLIGDVLLDLVSTRLLALADEGKSLLPFSDAVLASPQARYAAEEGKASGWEMDGIVLRQLDSPTSGVTADLSHHLNKAVFLAQRTQFRDFFVPGRWTEVLKLAAKVNPGMAASGNGRLKQCEEIFAKGGHYASALLVMRCRLELKAVPPEPLCQQGLESLRSYADSLEHSEARRRGLAAAVGYWGEAFVACLQASPSVRGEFSQLIVSLTVKSGPYDAVAVAVHLGFANLALPMTPRAYPWRANTDAQARFEQAAQEKEPEVYRAQMEQAAALGHAEAMFGLGDFFERSPRAQGQPDAARQWYEKTAAAGLPEAINWLGLAEKNGPGFGDEEIGKAFFHYIRAANLGLPEALCNAARLHLAHGSRPVDIPLGIALYQHGVRMNSPLAMYELGVCYAEGRGVPKSETKAFELYQQAAAEGFAPAQRNLAISYLEGLGTAKDADRAFAEMKASAEAGHSPAMVDLACFYAQGAGTTMDSNLAIAWLGKAVECGNADAKKLLAQWRRDVEGSRTQTHRTSTPQIVLPVPRQPIYIDPVPDTTQQMNDADESARRAMRNYRHQQSQRGLH